MVPLYKLIRESGTSPSTLISILMLACISSLLAVLPPHFLGATINALVGAGVSSQETIFSPIRLMNDCLAWVVASYSITPVILFLTMFFIFNFIYQVVRNIFAVYVSLFADNFILFIRKICFTKILQSKKNDISQFESGDLVHRTINDTQQLDYLIGTPLYTICSDIIDLIWISVILVLIDWKILFILTSVIPILYIISKKTGQLQRVYATTIQQNEASCTGFVQRTILGIDTVKAYQGEQREITAFSLLCDESFAARKRSSINLGFFFPQEGVLRALGTIAAIAYAAFLTTKDVTYIGAIPVLLVYTTKFYAPIGNWARHYQTIQRGIVSYRRLREILDIQEESPTHHQTARLEQTLPFKINGSIRLESGNTVSLSINATSPGIIILKGRSGVGKTRFIKSILGLGCAFDGDLKLGATSLPLHQDLRNHIALATQDGHFIPGTLAENISYPASKFDKNKCQRIIDSLQLNYNLDHCIIEYGRNLSIGEQRRVILGRALYSDKPVLILDEIDANVDKDTRNNIYQTIRNEMSKRVIIMVSHIHTGELNNYVSTSITMTQVE